MSTWLQTLVTIASVLFGGGGLVAIINAVTGRRQRRVDVVDRLSDSTLKWVEQFQEEASAARNEAHEARQELRNVRTEAEALARDLRDLRMAIMSPNASISTLREMVGGPGRNGWPAR